MNSEKLAAAEASYREAFRLSEEARQVRNALVLEALDADWTFAKIAEAMGVTRGRVGQIAQQLKKPA